MAQKKVADAGLNGEVLRTWIEPDHASLSVSRQCDLLGLARCSWYYEPGGETPENLKRAKDRIRQITQRNRGIPLEWMIREVNAFTTGWVTYFRHVV